MELPNFKYHPNPLATGSVKPSDAKCRCCGKSTGYIYAASVYAKEELQEEICPWCIANGEAAEQFGALFSDDEPLLEEGISPEICAEVSERTPGFNSWQQEEWLSHCNDACEFHGDAPKHELEALSGSEKKVFLSRNYLKEKDWENVLRHYQLGGNPAVYKFVCRHCKAVLYGMDFT